MAEVVFWVAALLALLGGVGVVVSRQPIRSVLSLVVVMLALAVLFLLLSAQFVFVVQIIVYAGAVMVLFLFVIALLGPIKESAQGRLRLQFTASVIVILIMGGFFWVMLNGVQFRAPQNPAPGVFGTVEQIGVALFTSYLYPFELTSVLLLVAAVGAIYLSRVDKGTPGE
ncbi:MAG TPA: NADH-quinone oxidoreductase subunit J [Candidatus Acidoferrales bacterium]|nr:NADH-quinone oxidoreductase subunit J [Candidatus Acidoferrales bacterium]